MLCLLILHYSLQPIILASLERLKEVPLMAVHNACVAEQRKLTSIGSQLPHHYAVRVASDDTVCVHQQSVQLHAGEMPAISAVAPLHRESCQ